MFSIRRATPQDQDSLQKLFQQSRSQALWLPDAVRVGADFLQESAGETVFIAASEKGDLLGLVSVFEPESFVHHLYVRSDVQRQGIGRALLAELRHFLPLPWRLKCPPGNVSALNFYKALGWWEAARGRSDWGEYLLLEFSGSQWRSGKS